MRELVSERLAATDSTHVKANASWASKYLKEVLEKPGVYWGLLDAYEDEGLDELIRQTGKRRKKRAKQISKVDIHGSNILGDKAYGAKMIREYIDLQNAPYTIA